MSWQDHKEAIESVSKVFWDERWHVDYGLTFDRVDQKTAMYIARNILKWRWPKKGIKK